MASAPSLPAFRLKILHHAHAMGRESLDIFKSTESWGDLPPSNANSAEKKLLVCEDQYDRGLRRGDHVLEIVFGIGLPKQAAKNLSSRL
jgi:hypothetical protein